LLPVKIVRFWHLNGAAYGVVKGGTIYALEGDLFGGKRAGPPLVPLTQARLLAPVLPSKIVAIALNYTSHAAEVGKALPVSPLFFLKPPTTVIGPGDCIVCPPESQLVHYEAELAVIIGRTACRVPEAKAQDFILGYTCANDVTARDIQRAENHNTRAKGFDTFLPLGPVIITDLDPSALRIQSRVNGSPRQDSTTANMIFKLNYLVSYVSHVMTLLPGDIISTGTPPGIGPLVAGDVVEVEVEGIGVLRNPVV
jgi:2-keto-4-pentenoate hydratase/2-oxohepta-3-ene-1,7-dioic acid hydratase in catechol pathway